MTIRCAVAIALTVGVQQALDDRSVSAFLHELQRAVARDDRPAVSQLVHYPLTVFAGDVRIPIGDAAALIQNYDLVFSPALKALISQAAVSDRGRAGAAAAVAIASDVAIIGVDTVQIRLMSGALKITKITVPLGAAAVATAPPPVTRDNRATGRAPQRLNLDVGQIQRAGSLAHGDRDAYLLSARKNQLLEVRINGVSGRDIVAKIAAVKSRAPIDSRARDGVRTWIGRIPDDGEYRIDVVRLAAGDARRLAYVVVIGLR